MLLLEAVRVGDEARTAAFKRTPSRIRHVARHETINRVAESQPIIAERALSASSSPKALGRLQAAFDLTSAIDS